MSTATTAARFAVASFSGKKFQLPEFFPTAEQREALRNLEVPDVRTEAARLDLVGTIEDMLCTGDGVSMDEREAIWTETENAFHSTTGFAWSAMLDIAKDTQEKPKEQAAAAAPAQKPQGLQIQSLTVNDHATLDQIQYKHGEFQTIHPEAFRGLLFGACSSRRAGITWQVWGTRATKGAGFHPSLVAHIARIAYDMPVNQLSRTR